MTNLLDLFQTAVNRHPHRVAIVDGSGRETTFFELQERSQALAAAWRAKGIRPGSRVLLAMGISADLYASLAALWSIGATVVLPEPAMGLAGLRHAADSTQPDAFCASGGYVLLKYLLPQLWTKTLLRPGQRALHVEGPPTEPEDPALISFTSGTSGQPKAIPRSHAFLKAQFDAVAPLLESDRDERDLVAFPVFTLVNLADGRTSILPNWRMSALDRVTPHHLGEWLGKQRVSRVLIPPSLCDTLLEAEVPDCLTTVFTGGGPVFPDIMEQLTDRKKVSVVGVYGSTEAEPISHIRAEDISDQDWRDMETGRGLLVGVPVPAVRVRIKGEEIQVAGPHVNEGYLDPRQNADNKIIEEGVTWHRTGDAGRFDEKGHLWLLGRVVSEITLDGRTLYPFAIEVAARKWPGVENSALMRNGDRPALVVQGDRKYLASWKETAAGFGVEDVQWIARIPMDKRHRSKVDRIALDRILTP